MRTKEIYQNQLLFTAFILGSMKIPLYVNTYLHPKILPDHLQIGNDGGQTCLEILQQLPHRNLDNGGRRRDTLIQVHDVDAALLGIGG